MRIERIAENKIKVTVGGDDIRMWNVDLKNFTDNTPEAQDMFWFALKRAEQDFNFTVGQSQLLVETMPSGDDEYILFISRLENEEEMASALIRAGKNIKQTELKARRRHRLMPLLRIYIFRDFEDLCLGVKEIRDIFMGTSKLTKYDGEFFLELVPVDAFGFFEIENILSEFAQKSKNPIFLQGALNEYGRVLIEKDAISVISQNFIK